MNSGYLHKVLVVVDDERASEAIDLLLKKENMESVFSRNAESALEEIKNAKKPFSLIIADQDLAGMEGTQFLEQAKKISPDTTRFLMAASSEMDTLINAVNRGSIQRYIAKPLNEENLTKTIQSGVKLYELLLDNEKLFNLAKKQNGKLYELNCELMEAAKSNSKAIRALDCDIEMLEKEIKNLSFQNPIDGAAISDEIEHALTQGPGLDSEAIQTFFHDTIKQLHEQFTELAQRNGLEMPVIKENEVK